MLRTLNETFRYRFYPLLAALLLAGCNQSHIRAKQVGMAAKSSVIGVTMLSMQNEFIVNVTTKSTKKATRGWRRADHRRCRALGAETGGTGRKLHCPECRRHHHESVRGGSQFASRYQSTGRQYSDHQCQFRNQHQPIGLCRFR